MGNDDDFYPPPMKENPKGFFENVRFRRKNDAVLANHHYKVKQWMPWVPEAPVANAKQINEMTELLGEYHKAYENWGWKDPRTSLVLNVWLDILDSYGLRKRVRILQCWRDPKDVAASMVKRGNKQKYAGQFEAVAMAYQCNLHLYAYIANFTDNVMTVKFKDLLHNTESTAKEISEFIGVPLDDLSHIDPSLERNDISESESNQICAGNQA